MSQKQFHSLFVDMCSLYARFHIIDTFCMWASNTEEGEVFVECVCGGRGEEGLGERKEHIPNTFRRNRLYIGLA